MLKYDFAPVLLVLLLGIGATSCRRSTDPSTVTGENQGPAILEGTRAPETGEVAISARVVDGDRVAFTIANGRRDGVELRRALSIEQETEEGWVTLEAVGEVWLRDDCQSVGGVLFPEGEAELCVELSGLTQIEAQPWLGTFGDAQCACDHCARVPAGRYRIVARGCEGDDFASNAVSIRLRDDAEE